MKQPGRRIHVHRPLNETFETPMPFFASDRERRLWGWTLAVVAAIYSTLGLARTLAVALQESGLQAALFVLGCLLVLATIVAQGLTTRPSHAEIGVALGVAAAYLLVFVRMAIPSERTHLVEYGVVAVFIYEALTERASRGRRVAAPALLTVLATSFLGVLDECIQAFLPSRVFDARDILFNVLAAVMAVATSVALGRVRRARARHSRGTWVGGLTLIGWALAPAMTGGPAAAQVTCERPDTTPERKEMAEFLWESDPAPRGMITVSHVYASDSAGPGTQGFRVGYGYLGGTATDYPWGEFWATFREDGDDDVTAAGLSVVPVARLSRRFGIGPVFDLGVTTRREPGRSVYAGLIGAGAEGVVRISHRWDLVTTAEGIYRTTSDTEFQVRFGIRFHHEKIPSPRR